MISDPPMHRDFEQLLARVQDQHDALLCGDHLGLNAAGVELARLMDELRSVGRKPLTSQEHASLKMAVRQLALNADLLARAAAGNQRALSVFFEPSATYGASGASRLASPTSYLGSVP